MERGEDSNLQVMPKSYTFICKYIIESYISLVTLFQLVHFSLVLQLLSRLGIPMSTAIDMYLHQIYLTGGIPFAVTLPKAPNTINADIRKESKGEIQMYRPIDQVQTGIKLKTMLKNAGYDVKFIQKYLHLSCPQSIYRWFQGKILPSVEHLCALSRLLGVHMEDLLVLEGQPMICDYTEITGAQRLKRLLAYANGMKKVA